MKDNNISPELKDIIEMLNRYLIVNKYNCCLVLSFLAFKNPNRSEVKNKACKTMLFGEDVILKEMIEDLNKKIDDHKGPDGFVGSRG